MFDFGDRAGDQFLEDFHVEVRQSPEVQAGLTHLVLPESGQALDLRGSLGNDVDDKVAAADREGGET